MTKHTSHTLEHHCEVHTGSDKEKETFRAKQFKTMQSQVNKIMKDWKGSPIVIVRSDDVDGGKNTQVQVMVLGVGGFTEQRGLLRGLHNAHDEIEQHLGQIAPDDPLEALKALLNVKK